MTVKYNTMKSYDLKENRFPKMMLWKRTTYNECFLKMLMNISLIFL